MLQQVCGHVMWVSVADWSSLRERKEYVVTHLLRRLLFPRFDELDRVWITYVGERPRPTGFEVLSVSKISMASMHHQNGI